MLQFPCCVIRRTQPGSDARGRFGLTYSIFGIILQSRTSGHSCMHSRTHGWVGGTYGSILASSRLPVTRTQWVQSRLTRSTVPFLPFVASWPWCMAASPVEHRALRISTVEVASNRALATWSPSDDRKGLPGAIPAVNLLCDVACKVHRAALCTVERESDNHVDLRNSSGACHLKCSARAEEVVTHGWDYYQRI